MVIHVFSGEATLLFYSLPPFSIGGQLNLGAFFFLGGGGGGGFLEVYILSCTDIGYSPVAPVACTSAELGRLSQLLTTRLRPA